MSREKTADEVLQSVMDSLDNSQDELDQPSRPSAPEEREAAEWTVAGIEGSTRVSTDFGEVPAHLVRVRDKLRSKDGRFLRVIRISEYKLDQRFLDLYPDARPVVIRPQALGRRFPMNTVQLSPAQRVAVPSDWSNRDCERADKLSSARASVDQTLGQVTYYSFDLGEPTMVQCEGLWVESHMN
ncbi:MAG: Hint domain-containing protein [Pseudomonadota bacterium]